MGLLGTVARGGAAGFIATIPMTAVMVIGQRATDYGRLPPEALVTNALGEPEPEPDAPDDGVDLELEFGWRAAHLAAGAAFGAMYALLFRPLTRLLPASLAGAIFGLGVWRISYQNVAPALELLPPADQDEDSRQTTNVLAHLVFGATLGLLLGRRR